MRRLLAPLSRWLDRRIDARIAALNADEKRRWTEWLDTRPKPAGLQSLIDAAAADMRAAAEVFKGGR